MPVAYVGRETKKEIEEYIAKKEIPLKKSAVIAMAIKKLIGGERND